MANTTTILTTPAHAKLEADSSTLDTTAERFNTIDQNLDTTADAGDTTGKNIFYDTNQTTNNITHLGVWFTNYLDKASWSGMDVTLEESDTDGSGYGGGGGTNTVTLGDNGLFLVELGAVVTKRYLKFIISDLHLSPPNPLIGQVFFLTERTFAGRPEFPQKTNPKFFNTRQNVGGGRTYSSAEAGDHIYSLERNFTFISSAGSDVVDDVWTDQKGSRRLFIYQEGTTTPEAKICRLIDEVPNRTYTEYDFYRLKMRMESLNYVRDGEVL